MELKRLLFAFTLFYLFTLFSGCAKNHTQTLQVETELRPYFLEFEEELHKRYPVVFINDLIIEFGEISYSTSVLATCTTKDNQTPRIIVDHLKWAWLSKEVKKALIFHELGHCVLGRGHITHKLSLMNPYLISQNVFRMYEEELIDELFDSTLVIN